VKEIDRDSRESNLPALFK